MWRRFVKDLQNAVQNFRDPLRFQNEKTLFDFSRREDFEGWSAFSDASFGGCSSATMTYHDEGFVKFLGTCSTEIKEGSKMKRSGFCGIRSSGNDDFIDVSEFQQLVLKIRGSEQIFLTNIRVHNFITDSESEDVWQAFFTCRGDQWHEVHVPLHTFVLTWKGKVVPGVTEMNAAKIMSLGITMSLPSSAKDNVDFYLDIASIKAAVGESTSTHARSA